MANEAVIIEAGNTIRRFTCLNSDSIEKGALLNLQDPRQVSGGTLVGRPAAGIAAEEKVANDGQTSIGVWQDGIFDCLATGAIPVGSLVRISGANTVGFLPAGADNGISGGLVLGKALETSTDGEVIAIKLIC
jgi:hypothetical protein